MVGNAAEEGLMGQIDNPSHVDRGRIVVPAAFLAGYGAGYLLWRLVPWVTAWGAFVVGSLVCVVVAYRLALRFERRDWARRSAEREAARAHQVAETDRQIRAMNAENQARQARR